MPPTMSPAPAPPYPGLRPFQSSEAGIFFGRAEQIDGMLAKLETRRFLAVLGASGSGKSSLVRAGLLPALADGFLAGASADWQFVVARPGIDPYAGLADAICRGAVPDRNPTVFERSAVESKLRGGRRGILDSLVHVGVPDGQDVLVVVDQFEELFRFRDRTRQDPAAPSDATDARNAAAAFVDLLLSTAQQTDRRVYVVLTMRSDFLGDCDAFYGLPEAISASQFLTPRLTRDQVAEAITGPLGQFGARAEPGLVNQILNDVGSDPDQLPLMQHALLRTWHRTMAGAGDGPVVLTAELYAAVGGMSQALDRHAEETYELLQADPGPGGLTQPGPSPKQRVAEWLFRSLAERTPKGQMVRRLTTVAEVARVAGTSPDEVIPVAELFAQSSRNFVFTAPPGALAETSTVDISHETLLRQWARLREWVKAEAEAAANLQRLVRDAKSWRDGARGVLRQPEVGLYQKWRTQSVPSTHWPTRYVDSEEFGLADQYLRHSLQRRRLIQGIAATAVIVGILFVIGVRQLLVDRQRAQHADGLVKRLLDSKTAQVPGIITEIEDYRPWADPLLRQEHANAPVGSPQRLRTSLALLAVDPGQVNDLYDRLLEAQPSEVPVIRDALAPYKDDLTPWLWLVAESPAKGKEQQRLRAAGALAMYAPQDQRWMIVRKQLANDLVAAPPVYLERWMDALSPVKGHLLTPLSEIYADRSTTRAPIERTLAASVLASYAADNPSKLSDLLMEGDYQQFAIIFPKLNEIDQTVIPILTAEVDKKLPANLPSSDQEREKLAKRQANAAVALLRMNQPAKVWALLKHNDDPRVRSYIIHRLSPLRADAIAVFKQLDAEQDVTVRRALLQGLADFSGTDLAADATDALLAKAQQVYREDRDPGIHASAEWLLRSWKQQVWVRQMNLEWAKDKKQQAVRLSEIAHLIRTDQAKIPPQWYVNGQSQTMVVIPGPVEFWMGSPIEEPLRRKDEVRHRRRIERTVAVASKSITVEQYRRFDGGYKLPDDERDDLELPVVSISWYQAAAYCNWLSEQEGIPPDQWCYETEPPGQIGPGVKIARVRSNYLALRGHRLPTEAEMEYVTRAGATTARHFGETEELLSYYAVYARNARERTAPVGSRKPNDLGLFDTHGNVWTWCGAKDELYSSQGDAAVVDHHRGLEVKESSRFALRGGSFLYMASVVRAAFRIDDVPTFVNPNVGFRIARTVSAE